MLKMNPGQLIIGCILIVGVGMIIGLQFIVIRGQQPSTLLVDELTERIAAELQTAEVSSISTATDSTTTTSVADQPNTELVVGDSSRAQQPLLIESLTTVDDESRIPKMVADDPAAIGFVGRRADMDETDTVRTVPLLLADGTRVAAAPDVVINGNYPIATAFYLYSTAQVIQQKPQIAAFIACYLSRVNMGSWESGYFPARPQIFKESLNSFNRAIGHEPLDAMPSCEVNAADDGPINIVGSMASAPITQHLIELFIQDGFSGKIMLNSSGTAAGFESFCTDIDQDMVDADRPIDPGELSDCLAADRAPLAFAIGQDAVSVVVSKQNDFVKEISLAQIRKILAGAETWSAVNPRWPATPIVPRIPSQTSSTFNTLVRNVFDVNGDSLAIVRTQPTPAESRQAISNRANTAQLAAATPHLPTVAPPTATDEPTREPTVVPTDTPTPVPTLRPTTAATATVTATTVATATVTATTVATAAVTAATVTTVTAAGPPTNILQPRLTATTTTATIPTATIPTATIPTATIPTATTTPTPRPTDTPTAAPTATALPAVDFTIGQVADREQCKLVAQVLATVIERDFGRTTRILTFADEDELYANLTRATDTAENWPDFAPCYLDPDDREFLLIYQSQMSLLGREYSWADDQKLYIVAHPNLAPKLEWDDPCLFNWLHNLQIAKASLTNRTGAEAWLAENVDTVASWIECN